MLKTLLIAIAMVTVAVTPALAFQCPLLIKQV